MTAGFQHVENIGDKLCISLLEDNIKSFLDYSFLKIGGFVNVNIPTSGMYGGDFATLKLAQDPARPNNSVWEAVRKDWVYESGIDHNDNTPNQVSGIYYNNTFLPAPTGSGDYGYYINYPLGQVVFNCSKHSIGQVRANYSYRYIQVYKANESTWWKELQKLSYDPTSGPNKGQNITSNHRVQLPAIVIETIARTTQTPYELGNSKNIIGQDLLLHIYTENPIQRNSIADILLLQKDRETFLYDINTVIASGYNPLNYRGEINSSGLNYDQIISNQSLISNVFYIENASLSEMNTISNNLYNAVIRWTLKIYP